MQLAQVILPLNVKGTFTYEVPSTFLGQVLVGMRVVVPFGGKKLYTGIVTEIHARTPEGFKPKEIISILDRQALVPLPQLQFWQWLADYYLCNLGEVYRMAIPSSLKLESETYLRKNPNQEIDFSILEAHEILLMQALEVQSNISLKDLEAFIPRKEIFKTLNTLLENRLIIIDEKIAEKYKAREVAYVRLKPGILEQLSQVLSQLERAYKQKALLLKIVEKTSAENPMIKKSELLSDSSFSSAQLKALYDKGIVEEFYENTDRLQAYEGALESLQHLSPAQQEALTQIDQQFENQEAVLLHGVAGSGKTHLYVAEAEKTLARGKNVLMLFPEVSLTKQIIRRLEKKYGQQLGFYHSKLSDFEKVEVWQKVKSNRLKIILGTRNALFLPFQNLGLVVVDEEHDSLYKPSTVTPYFNAKDAALVLAQKYTAKTLLGSATPSVESYYFAQKGKLGYVELKERFGHSSLAKTSFINFKEAQNLKAAKGSFSFTLIEKIQKEIENHRQVIILHNRRGYASVVECESCGYVQYCSNCDVVMTYHKPHHELKCHYCGQTAAMPKVCPSCHSESINIKGMGIQQLEEEVVRLFPQARVGRMDFDSMRRKFAYEKFFEKVDNHELDILVGTQMVAKGLDFDFVDVVTVPKADALLHIQDFRAEERAYQLLMQLAGRAGRTSQRGEMVIQTFNPDHEVFRRLANAKGDVYQYFIDQRKKFYYPPFIKLIFIEIKHRKEDKAERAAKFYGAVLQKYLPSECILGPEKANIAKLNNLYQYQILLKLPRGKKYKDYKAYVKKAQEEFEEIKGYQSVKTSIFVDY